MMDLHTVKGAYILSAVGSVLKEVVPIVVAHHKYFADTLENNDVGTNKIPLGARVIAVADAYDAMTTDPPLPQRHAALGGISGDRRQNKQAIRSRSG